MRRGLTWINHYDNPEDAPDTLDIDPDARLPEIRLVGYTPEHALC
ncbi:MAG: hypothetical protein ACUVRV_00775 [Cyanobacteriota bacterium]